MELLFKILWFFVHIALSAIFIDMLGSLMSQQQDIFITLFEGLLLSLIMISILLHVKHLFLYFKKQTKQ
jgi:hypothetical protein